MNHIGPSAQCYLAPAKLNLFLHVTGRRPDGYHTLQSVFVPIDWFDELRFVPVANRIVRIDESEHAHAAATALPPMDLSVRAALALRAFVQDETLGCEIYLKKCIPTQAGMGGGSSDAATTLLALNALWDLNLPTEVLCRIGLRLGADIAFFLHRCCAWVEGIGEQVKPLCAEQVHSCLPRRYLVIKPEQGVSTAAVFGAAGLPENTNSATMEGFIAWQHSRLASAAKSDSNGPLLFGKNDLQGVASSLNPQIDIALGWLAGLGLQGRLSGSGSAVFAALPEALGAEQVQKQLKLLDPAWTARLCNLVV